MKLDRKTTLTLIGIFIIAGLCVGGYSSVGYEGLDVDIEVGSFNVDTKETTTSRSSNF